MNKINQFSVKAVKKTEVAAPAIFSAEKENMSLLAQALHVYRSNDHVGTKFVKGRGDVARTTKKWFKQKGTGNARHGDRKAPIFVGGGKAHGPRNPKRELSLPKKMSTKALSVALHLKNNAGKVVLLSDIATIKKTKDAAKAISIITKDLKTKKDAKLTLVLAAKNKEVYKFVRNIANLNVINYKDLNAYSVYLGGLLIFDADIFAKPKAKAAKKETKK